MKGIGKNMTKRGKRNGSKGDEGSNTNGENQETRRNYEALEVRELL
jgi:hypothetical protein